MKKIAVFLADGFEEIEGLTVVDLCRRAGIETDMVSIEDGLMVTGSHKIVVLADMLFEEVDINGLDMLVLPGGGPGSKRLEAHSGLMEKLDAFYQEGRYIAAICAAPSILGHRGMLKGRKACSYPSMEEHLEGALVSRVEVEIDGHIITSRGMGSSIAFGLAIIRVLCGKEKAEELAATIVYQI